VDLDSVPARPEPPDRSAAPPPGNRRGWGVTREVARPSPASARASPRGFLPGGAQDV